MSSPVKTLEKARDMIRQARLEGNCINKETTIYILDGDYKIDDTVEFTVSDSGTELFPLKIKAYDNAKVRLYGGVDIYENQLSKADNSVTERIVDESARGNIKAINLFELGITKEQLGKISRRGHQVSENKIAQAEVSVDGERMKLAGWPNEGFVGMDKVVEYGTRRNPSANDNGTNITNGCAFTYSDYDRPQYWSNPEKAWLSGTIGPNFAYDYYPLASVDTKTKTIRLKEGAITDYYSKHYFRFENILEELDMPGEYYIDRDNGMLYIYMPSNSTSSSKITVSTLENSIIKLNNVKNIAFEGIEFEAGRASAVSASGVCYGITVDNCKIHSFGADGVSLSNSRFSTVKNCKIYDIGKNAIAVKGGDYSNIISSGITIFNNDIYRFSQLERSYTAGVYIGYQSVGVKVMNNHIHNAPHAGVIFYGVNNKISHNEFDDLVNEFHDMDAVYVNNYEYPWERGNVIEYNLFRNIGNKSFNGEKQMNVAAVRTDNGGHGLVVKHNIFYKIGQRNTNSVSGVHAQGTRNIIEENMFVDCSEAYLAATSYDPNGAYDLGNAKTAQLKQKTDEYVNGMYGTVFPELKNFWNEYPTNSKTNSFSNNLVVNISIPLSTVNNVGGMVQNTDGQGYRGARETVNATGNYVTNEDVGFKNYENGDLQLNANSAVYGIIPKFGYINVSAIGRR